ncbi:MAG TPA: hypothetical protein VGD46_13400 [Rhizobacter sp.]
MQEQGAVIVVGLTGLARSGKDTAASVLVEEFGFRRLAFADALKEGCAAMLGLPLHRMYEGDRESILPEWGFSIRDFLQRMGTECVRTQFGADFWIKAVCQRIASKVEQGNLRFVISDARFDNEAQWVLSHATSHVVRVVRPGIAKMDHASERGISDTLVTATLGNTEGLDAFKDVVRHWATRNGL